MAHSILDIVWHLLTTGDSYQDLGADYFERRHDPQRQTRRLIHQLEQLGYHVTLQPTAA